MKTPSTLIAALLFLLAALSVNSQVVSSVFVGKTYSFRKDSAGAPVQDTSNPFGSAGFDVTVAGSDMALLTAPVITLPAGSTYPTVAASIHNGGTLVYDAGDEHWNYGFPNANDIAAPPANINGYFGSGTYSIFVQGTTVSFFLGNIGGDGSFDAAFSPDLTFSQGTWSGGKLLVDPSQALTITTSTMSNYASGGSTIGGHIGLGLDGIFDLENWSRVGPAGVTLNEVDNFITYTISPGTLTAGIEYGGEASFDGIRDQSLALAGSLNGTYYGNITTFTIQAIPEPSTYAALAGLGALGLAFWQRRRKAV